MHRRLSIKDESVICGSKGFTVAKVGKRVDRRGGGGGCSSVLERVRAKELQRKVEAGVRRGDEGHEGDGGCLSRRVDEVKGRVEAILREERARGSVLSERKLLQRVVDSYDGGIEEELVKKAVDAVRWRGADGRRCAGIKDVKDTTNIKDINGIKDVKDGKDVKDTTNIKDINGSEDIKDGKDVKDTTNIKDINGIKDVKDGKDVKDTTNIKDINGSEDIKDGKDVKDTTNIKDINGSEDIKDGKDVKDINGSTGSIGR